MFSQYPLAPRSVPERHGALWVFEQPKTANMSQALRIIMPQYTGSNAALLCGISRSVWKVVAVSDGVEPKLFESLIARSMMASGGKTKKRRWRFGSCPKPEPGTQTMPVSSIKSKTKALSSMPSAGLEMHRTPLGRPHSMPSIDAMPCIRRSVREVSFCAFDQGGLVDHRVLRPRRLGRGSWSRAGLVRAAQRLRRMRDVIARDNAPTDPQIGAR